MRGTPVAHSKGHWAKEALRAGLDLEAVSMNRNDIEARDELT